MGVGAVVTSEGRKWGCGWGGDCFKQEGQMGQGRVEVKGGGKEPILGGSLGQEGEQMCVCVCAFPMCMQVYFCIQLIKLLPTICCV